jgi:carboxyl-terminal processing protease
VPTGAGGIVNKLRDVFVYANDQKVFFKVVPESGASGKLDFAADVPLKPGNNAITIFAREDDEFQTRRTILVHRRGAGEVAQQAAPAAAQPSR